MRKHEKKTIIESKPKVCNDCDWFEAEFGRCELKEIEVHPEDKPCDDFIEEVCE